MLLDDALAGVELVSRLDGPIVDVGSGGGTPGIPLAASLPERAVTLLEAERRKCEFLERWTSELPNLEVVWGRAEEQPLETYGVAVAKALAQPADGASSGACRSSAKAARSCSGSARPPSGDRVAAGGRADRRRARGRPRRVPRDPQDRPDAARVPPPHRHGAEAPARLSLRSIATTDSALGL